MVEKIVENWLKDTSKEDKNKLKNEIIHLTYRLDIKNKCYI